MKRKFSYSIGEMNRRLLAIGKSIRGYLVISTLSSIIGALAHMGLMGFGALWLLAAAGFCGNFALYGILTVGCAILIAVSRYLEGVFSHMGAYGILAKMRVQLFDSIDRVAPAWLIGRETGDLMNIAVSDIETLEFFFAHTIGPMFSRNFASAYNGNSGILRQSVVRMGPNSNLSYDQRGASVFGA